MEGRIMKDNLIDFLNSIQSVCINSLDDKDFPFSSYAPFVRYNNKYYVYLSLMAKHSQNLIINNKSSLLFIEDEKDCKNIFARKRVSLQCHTKKFKQNSEEEKKVLNEFKSKFDSDMVSMLEKMSDFYVFEFTPIYGETVFGFGKAYNVGGENFDELIQRAGQSGHGHGHGKK
jgi:putative heme iron utilization protein